MPVKIERAKGADAFRQQMVNFVCERQAHSERHFMSFRKKLPALYHLDRGTTNFRYQPWRNNVSIPIIHSLIRASAAKITEALLGQFPYVNFVGYGPDDAPIAQKQTALVSAQMEDMGLYRKMYDALVVEGLYGTTIVEHGWKHKVGNRVIYDTISLPLSGKTERAARVVKVTEFDGPDIRVPDLLDCFPQSHQTYFREMQWFIIRRWMDWDDIVALSYAEPGGIPVFDRPEVLRMEREGGGAADAYDMYKDARYNRFAYQSPESVWKSEPYGRPVMVYEYWGIVPSELRKYDVETCVITVANKEYLLRYRSNPHLHGEKPFFAYSGSPDPHFFFPAGKAEMSAKLQIAANRFTNQQLDALDLYINPFFVYNELSGLDPDNAQVQPGRWFPIQGSTEGAFQAITPDLRGIEFGTIKTQEMGRWIQQAMGEADDISLGLAPGGRESARGVLARQDAVQARTMVHARLFEKEVMEPLGNVMMSYNQQYLDTPREIFILGPNAVRDPITGKPIQVTRAAISDFDLTIRYAARARGAVSRLGKGIRVQNKLLALQAAQGNPIVAGATNWINFFRDVYADLDFERVDEILSTQEEYERKIQLMQGGGGAPNRALPGVAPNLANPGGLSPETYLTLGA